MSGDNTKANDLQQAAKTLAHDGQIELQVTGTTTLLCHRCKRFVGWTSPQTLAGLLRWAAEHMDCERRA